MKVTGSDAAVGVIEEMLTRRSGTLTITIGTGCCESTAPFLYEDFWPGPDQEVVGEVAGVAVHAPAYLRDRYPDDDGMVIDVSAEFGESLSVETELGVRLILRGPDFSSEGEPEVCRLDAEAEPELRPVVGQLPAELRGLRMR